MSVREKIRGKYKGQKKPASSDRTIQNLTAPAEELNPSGVADLRPAGYNPRVITADKLKMLNDAMKEFGDLGGIVFNVKTGRLVGGHQRVKNLDPAWPILKEATTDETGTVAHGFIDTPHGRFTYREVAWTELKEKAANIAANKHGGEFDDDILTQLLQELHDTGYDMDLTGFDSKELEEMLGLGKEQQLGVEDPDVVPVPDPFVKLGDLWVLGDNRILCGDSTSIADIDKLMMGEKADLVVTDPPYNVAYESKAGKIDNDNMSDEAFKAFLLSVFSMMHYALKPGGCFYIYHADGGTIGTAFRSAVSETKDLYLAMPLIWAKNTAVLSRTDYNPQHEPILYGWRLGAAHYYDGDFTRTSLVDDKPNISKMSLKELQKYTAELEEKLNPKSSVIRVDRPTKNDIHPTMKPVRLFERNIYTSSRPGEVVLDLFSGSGTLVVACRKTGRRGRGMEYSPQYLQASLKRYWDYCQEEPMLMDADGKLTPYSEVEKQRKS